MRLERRLRVLGQRPGHAADLFVAPPREQTPLAIPMLPEAGHRKREQRQRPSLLGHVPQHVVDEPVILEPVPGEQRRLHERAAQRRAERRRERHQLGEDRVEVLECLAPQQEIVPERQQDVHVGLEHESSEQLCEAALYRRAGSA